MRLAEHQRGYLLCRFLLHRRDGVGVGVERDRDGGMPEPLRDDLRMNAGGERERRVCVPEDVRRMMQQTEAAGADEARTWPN